jgi:hypothetical protein
MTSRCHDTEAFLYQKAGCDVVTCRAKVVLSLFHQHVISLSKVLTLLLEQRS